MTIESLLAAYTAWALAWVTPLWLGSYLHRSMKRTFAYDEPAAEVPAMPDRAPRIHLTAA